MSRRRARKPDHPQCAHKPRSPDQKEKHDNCDFKRETRRRKRFFLPHSIFVRAVIDNWAAEKEKKKVTTELVGNSKRFLSPRSLCAWDVVFCKGRKHHRRSRSTLTRVKLNLIERKLNFHRRAGCVNLKRHHAQLTPYEQRRGGSPPFPPCFPAKPSN